MASTRENPAESHPELNSQSLEFAEQMYSRYAADPQSVSADWRDYFAGLSNGAVTSDRPNTHRPDVATPSGAELPPAPTYAGTNGQPLSADLDAAAKQERIDQLIRNYRVRGHI